METYKNLIALTQSMAKFDDFNNKSKSSEDLLKEAEELYAADENDLAKILKNVDKTNLTVKSRKLPSGNVNLSYMDSKGREVKSERYDANGVLKNMQIHHYNGNILVATDYYKVDIELKRVLKEIGTPNTYFEEFDGHGKLICRNKL